MGLDITAYKGIKKLDCVFDADGEPIDPVTRKEIQVKYFQAFHNTDFSERAEGVEDRGVYAYEDAMGFCAGSYGGYNGWRNALAEMAGYPAAEYEQYGKKFMGHDQGAWNATSGPFWELILFSDCEGVIGPVVATKLAKDFAEYQEKADSFGDEYWREKYALWRKAFEMAAQNGVVSFH